MSTPETTLTCASCGEVNREGTVACARCGRSLLSEAERRERRAQVEQWRREAERESVDYTTTANLLLDRFIGVTPKRLIFKPISNHRKKIGLLCAVVSVVAVVLLGIATGR